MKSSVGKVIEELTHFNMFRKILTTLNLYAITLHYL